MHTKIIILNIQHPAFCYFFNVCMYLKIFILVAKMESDQEAKVLRLTRKDPKDRDPVVRIEKSHPAAVVTGGAGLERSGIDMRAESTSYLS